MKRTLVFVDRNTKYVRKTNQIHANKPACLLVDLTDGGGLCVVYVYLQSSVI